jgi:hypothetical protein
MKKLKRFWRAFEEPYGVLGVREEWRRHLGAELAAASPFLRKLKEPSATYPCPRRGGDGCPRRVVIHGPEDIVAVCGCVPKECDTLKLKREDIAVYELDRKRFCGFLAESLGMTPVAEAVGPRDRVWHVGSLAVTATDHRPVFLVASPSRSSFDGAIGSLLVAFQGPFTVLTPTLRFVGATATEGLRQRGAALLALDEVIVESGDGRLVTTAALADLLAAEGGRVLPEAEEKRNLFRREQDFWLIAFQGKTVRHRHMVGFDYVAELLRRPGVEVEALSLAGRPECDSEAVVASSGLEMTDDKALREVRAALQARKNELAAVPAKDWPKRGKLQDEIAKLEDYLFQAEGKRGRARKIAGSAQRARTAATNAIVRAIQSVEKDHKDLAAHLHDSVRTGTTLIYLPATPIDWQF